MNNPESKMTNKKILAFPTHGWGSGMELRDWFAGQALNVLIGKYLNVTPDKNYDKVAEICYKMADAMMKERERQKDEINYINETYRFEI